MPQPTTTWTAVLHDEDGDVYPTVADAIKALGEDSEISIAIVRDTALPVDRDDRLRMPGIYNSGDKAHEDEVYLVDEDTSFSADVRYAQAQAMADGLNACLGSVPPRAQDELERAVIATARTLRDSLVGLGDDTTAEEDALAEAVDALDAAAGREPQQPDGADRG